MDQAGLARLFAGHDAAISSVHFLASDPARLIGAAKYSKVGRYLVVGGAGSLEVAPGVRLVTTPGFPVAYKAEAEKGGPFSTCWAEKELNWTFLSPSALFTAGERTGKFRLGTDQLLTAADGKSWISFEDFAVALADEIERPAHIGSVLRSVTRRRPAPAPITLPVQGLGGGVPGDGPYCLSQPAAI